MIRKIFRLLRSGQRQGDIANTLLHNVAQEVQPPEGLLSRIETSLDRGSHKRTGRQFGLWAAGVLLSGVVLTTVSLSEPSGYILVDVTGRSVARIEVKDSVHVVYPADFYPTKESVWHLWAGSATGQMQHVAAIDTDAETLTGLIHVKSFAMSLETPGFAGVLPKGPVLAVSRPDNFFWRSLHPY